MHFLVPTTAAAALGVLLVSLAPGSAATETAAELRHGKMVGANVSVTGTVTDVDVADRRVTVMNAQGEERSFRVDPAVKSLGTLKTGDRVQVDYLLAMAVALSKGGEGIRQKVESEAAAHAPQDGKPSVQKERVTTLVANVLSVDRARHSVRLQGPAGRIGDVKVRDPAALADVQPGDQVVAVVYEALAVGVKPTARAESGAARTDEATKEPR
jgi:Cu/Ag efflux protein CusF